MVETKRSRKERDLDLMSMRHLLGKRLRSLELIGVDDERRRDFADALAKEIVNENGFRRRHLRNYGGRAKLREEIARLRARVSDMKGTLRYLDGELAEPRMIHLAIGRLRERIAHALRDNPHGEDESE